MNLDTCNRITAKQLNEMISFSLETRWDNPDERLPAIMVWGPPGVGKSAIVRSVAEAHGCGFIDLRLAQMEAIDIKGLPVPEQDGVHWKISSTYPRDQKSRGILFLDELSACDRTIQTAAYELILDRRLGEDYRLPDGWLIVAAGNRIEDGASAVAMSSALANRFLHVELAYDVQSWHEWAVKNDVHGAVVGLLQFKPQLLADMDENKQNLERGFPTPRSWERASVMLHRLEGKDDAILTPFLCGLLGNATGLELLSFYHIYDEMRRVVEMMLDPKAEISIPKDQGKRYAFCTALCKVLWDKDKGTQEERLNGFFRISIEMPSDFAAMSMLDAMNSNPNGAESNMLLVRHKKYAEWLKKHGKALRGRAS